MERRKRPSTPEVRSWITALRSNGGDFDEEAAMVAGQAAAEAQRQGHRASDVFAVARAAYYASIQEQKSHSSGD